MDAIEKLIAAEEIKTLRARYWRCLDTKDWDGWASVFTEDCTLIFDGAVSTGGRDGQSYPKVETRQGMKDFVSGLLQNAVTVHQGHTPEIDFLSDTEAKGIWPMEDIVEHADYSTHGHGHYHDTYRKVDGEWLISSVHLTRLRIVNTYRQRTPVDR
jgi:uncharacterized protein (TIGR02246 family)